MTTYTTIANGDVDQDSPVTQPLMTALRDNPIAITEGSTGAPKIQDAALDTGSATASGITWVGKRTGGASAGGVGTYVFASAGTSDLAFGNTRAGSSLTPTSAVCAISDTTSAADIIDFDSGSALSGTWRCMGTYDYLRAPSVSETGPDIYGATLWVRIS